MMTPKVTVLTAVRNGARYLPETIGSIQQQTYRDWEYLIVDDASDDNTVEIVEAARAKDSRIRLFRRALPGGPYIAANDGIGLSRGEFIIRTDADDLSPRHRIESQYRFLRPRPEFAACVSHWDTFNERGTIPNSVATLPSNSRVFRWYLLLRSPSIHSAVCYRKAAMLELGGYRPLPLSQDYRLWCELTRRNWLAVIPQVLSHVRAHEGRESITKKSLQRQLALDILEDHLLGLTGQKWGREDLLALWSVGHSEPMVLEKGIEMLRRWEQMWHSSPDLTKDDRKELSQWLAMRRWKHLRANARSQPTEALVQFVRIGAREPLSLFHGWSFLT